VAAAVGLNPADQPAAGRDHRAGHPAPDQLAVDLDDAALDAAFVQFGKQLNDVHGEGGEAVRL
jgi:hypothetical protein